MHQSIAQEYPNPLVRNNIVFDCEPGTKIARELEDVRPPKPGDTSRRQAADARHVVRLLRKMHFHRAHCVACLLREAISAGGLQ